MLWNFIHEVSIGFLFLRVMFFDDPFLPEITSPSTNHHLVTLFGEFWMCFASVITCFFCILASKCSGQYRNQIQKRINSCNLGGTPWLNWARFLLWSKKFVTHNLKEKDFFSGFTAKDFLFTIQYHTIPIYLNHLVTVERLQVAPFPTVHGADELKRGLVTEEEEPPECRICGGGTEAEGRWPGKPQRNEGGCILSSIDYGLSFMNF